MGPVKYKRDSGWLKRIISLSALGMTLVIATMIGFALGYYLDTRFGTKPWLSLVFFCRCGFGLLYGV